ncbi:MAG: hypothetical protein ACE5KT_05755 [Methanosarcinales archaeon]
MFASDWTEETTEEGITEYFPSLKLYIKELEGIKVHNFLVDSGASIGSAKYVLIDYDVYQKLISDQ